MTENKEPKGCIFDIQRYSIHDGPGIRTTVDGRRAAPLIATLMLGNLMRESGVVEGLSRTAQEAITNTSTLFLGLVIGSTMQGAAFLNLGTLISLHDPLSITIIFSNFMDCFSKELIVGFILFPRLKLVTIAAILGIMIFKQK